MSEENYKEIVVTFVKEKRIGIKCIAIIFNRLVFSLIDRCLSYEQINGDFIGFMIEICDRQSIDKFEKETKN